jgi:hypothetical protein
LGGGINSVIKRVGKQVMEDLEVFPMDFKYYIHFDRDINESKEKQPNYLSVIKDIIEPLKNDDCVCDIDMWYDDEDDRYSVYLVFGTEELNGKFTHDGKFFYVRKKIKEVKEAIKSYLPIDNLNVGSYGKPNCEWKSINESKETEPKYLSVIKDITEPFKDEDCVCDISVLYNDEDDMYLIDVSVGTEELNDRFFADVGRTHYVKTLRLRITKAIMDYLPIDNFYVGSYGTPYCG